MIHNAIPVQHYFINLDRSPERREHMENLLGSAGFPHIRVPGIDGVILPDDTPGVDRALYRRCHGREIRSGEIGCYLSHLKALETFLQSDHPHAVIMEDDAVLRPEYSAVLARVCAPEMLDSWDMVKFQCRRKRVPLHLHDLTGNAYLGVAATRSTGATAYLVNRLAARHMLDGLLPIQVPWDHAFDRPIHLYMKVRHVYPHPVYVDLEDNELTSTIETGRSAKAKGLNRFRTHLWRAESEASRMVDALWTYGKSKLAGK